MCIEYVSVAQASRLCGTALESRTRHAPVPTIPPRLKWIRSKNLSQNKRSGGTGVSPVRNGLGVPHTPHACANDSATPEVEPLEQRLNESDAGGTDMDPRISDTLRLLASKLLPPSSRAAHVTILTGAGISAESGLQTFRGTFRGSEPDMSTLWKDFDPQTLATPEAFARDPEMVSRWYDWRRLGCLAAEPNPGHLALAQLERLITTRGGSFTLLTQNVDRLHHRAGSRNVIELHGSIIEWRCTRTGALTTPPPTPFESFPPKSAAGALLRPNVVWFGEMLPESALAAAADALDRVELFLSIGTSSVVYPAAGFVHQANANAAYTVEINAEDTPISSAVDQTLRGPAGTLLPALLREITHNA
jgi:NAD-dependent deacetylase